MKRSLLTGLLLLLLQPTAWAESWLLLHHDDGGNAVFIDQQSIQRLSSRMTYVIQVHYKELQDLPYGKVRAINRKKAVYCPTKKMSPQWDLVFDEHGRRIYVDAFQNAPFESFAPGSVAELEYEVVCNRWQPPQSRAVARHTAPAVRPRPAPLEKPMKETVESSKPPEQARMSPPASKPPAVAEPFKPTLSPPPSKETGKFSPDRIPDPNSPEFDEWVKWRYSESSEEGQKSSGASLSTPPPLLPSWEDKSTVDPASMPEDWWP